MQAEVVLGGVNGLSEVNLSDKIFDWTHFASWGVGFTMFGDRGGRPKFSFVIASVPYSLETFLLEVIALTWEGLRGTVWCGLNILSYSSGSVISAALSDSLSSVVGW